MTPPVYHESVAREDFRAPTIDDPETRSRVARARPPCVTELSSVPSTSEALQSKNLQAKSGRRRGGVPPRAAAESAAAPCSAVWVTAGARHEPELRKKRPRACLRWCGAAGVISVSFSSFTNKYCCSSFLTQLRQFADRASNLPHGGGNSRVVLRATQPVQALGGGEPRATGLFQHQVGAPTGAREFARALPARREPTRVRARAPRDQDASECETLDRDFASSRLRDTKQLFAVLEGHKVHESLPRSHEIGGV